jgi:hypothetical protein
MATNATEKTDGVVQLVRQTADDLVDLVGQHLKLARLELTADLLAAARSARATVLLALLATVGYALAMAGLALLVGGRRDVAVAFVAVGLVHIGIGGLGVLFRANRARGTRLMSASAHEAKRSLATLGSVGEPAVMETPRAL